MNRSDRSKTPLRHLTTYGVSRAPRLPEFDYKSGDIHVTIRANDGKPFLEQWVAELVTQSVEECCRLRNYRLYGYCLMPDHLHILLSPEGLITPNAATPAPAQPSTHLNAPPSAVPGSVVPLSVWLRAYKSFTTNAYQKRSGQAQLWQRSAHDHICRSGETAEKTLIYIINNPVRAGLVARWDAWPWTRVLIDL